MKPCETPHGSHRSASWSRKLSREASLGTGEQLKSAKCAEVGLQGTFSLDPPVRAERSCRCSGLLGHTSRDCEFTRIEVRKAEPEVVPVRLPFAFTLLKAKPCNLL